MQIKTLIDLAAAEVGGMAALSLRIRQPQSRLRDWKAEVKPCPLRQQIRLCELAGLDDTLTMAHLRNAASRPTPKKTPLLRDRTKNE